MRKSYIFLAEGFETIEALTPLDVLRRGGMEVETVSITSALTVTSVQGLKVSADRIFDPAMFNNAEWLILPGGMPGAENLYNFAPLCGLLHAHAEKGGKIASICASPGVVLGQLGLLNGNKATCYPGFESMLKDAEYVDVPVVTDGNFVLGNGPANALLWSLAILKAARGQETADKVASDMLFFRTRENLVNFFG